MGTKVLRCVSLMIFIMVMNFIEVQGQDLTVSDTQNSGCLRTRSYDGEEGQIPTIILEKESNILSVQLINYESNCATYDFAVNSSIREGDDDLTCSLSINVAPLTGDIITSCICPFNVSFTVNDLEQNSFYLTCWWYKGLVEMIEGEPLVLKDVKEDVTIDGMNYTLRKAMRHAMVTKNEYTGEVNIPSELSYEGQTYSVTSIDGYAFRENTTVTKITIPRTVKYMNFEETKEIDGSPFIGCTALKSIEVEEGNPVLCAIDGVLFNKEKTRLYTYPAAANHTSYTVPEGVTKVEVLAFSKNQHLVNVTLPDQITSLGSSVFYGCTNLEEVTLPSNLKTLEGWMFGECKHLKSVTIPDGVTYLGISLFSGCSSLTSVTMPESVKSTGYAIFENCKSLRNVTLSPNLDEINHNLFLNCSSLKEIIIPEGVTAIMSNAFQNCTTLRTIDIPESVYRLGDYVFSGCKLESLYIRGIIDSRWIDDYVFKGMDTKTKLYVQPSEVEKFQRIYRGKVYPIPDQTNSIFYSIRFKNNSSELFDLQGRQILGEPNRGIFILNGQKRIVK